MASAGYGYWCNRRYILCRLEILDIQDGSGALRGRQEHCFDHQPDLNLLRLNLTQAMDQAAIAEPDEGDDLRFI
jgi:hypothetical protein